MFLYVVNLSNTLHIIELSKGLKNFNVNFENKGNRVKGEECYQGRHANFSFFN